MLSSNKKNLIITNRKNIHNVLVSNVFKDKGGKNFTTIDNKCILKTFNIYDSYIFNNQITNKLQEDGNSIKFVIDSERVDIGSICKVKSVRCKRNSICNKYELCINVKVILILIKLEEEIKQFINIKNIDRVYCFQIIIEHVIIHLLMVMWNYMYRDCNGKDCNIYTSHGRLYNCILKNYFGYEFFSKLKLSDVEGLLNLYNPSEKIFKKDILIMTNQENIINNIGLLENWSNSCYIDSLLMSLFLGESEVPRNSILEVNISKIDYKSWTPEEYEKDLKYRRIKIFKKLTTTPGFETETRTREFIVKLQKSLVSDYEKITISKNNFKCIETRSILATYIPEMKPNGANFCSYPVGDLYESIADIFPGLKMKYIPSIVNSAETGIYNKASVIEERKSFLFWDFIGPEEDEGVTPLWDIIESPMLVFQNGLVPPITDYGSMKSEKVIVRGLIPGKFEVINEKLPTGEIIRKTVPKIGSTEKIIEKARVFGEYIINDRYRLFAVVRNHGNKPTMSGINDFGGGHYSAYIRPFFDNQNWYNYNDIGPTWELTINKDKTHLNFKDGKLPEDTFLDSAYSRPELLFYQKIKSSI
jgi:hypothetical protein